MTLRRISSASRTAHSSSSSGIAMSALVLGLATRDPVRVDDGAFIDTSFPGFVSLMNAAGAAISADA